MMPVIITFHGLYTTFSMDVYFPYFTDTISDNAVHGKTLVGLVNLVNRESFAKIFLVSIHRYTGNGTDCCFLPIFSSLIAFTYMHGSPKISPTKYFLCTVLIHALKVADNAITKPLGTCLVYHFLHMNIVCTCFS